MCICILYIMIMYVNIYVCVYIYFLLPSLYQVTLQTDSNAEINP